MMNGNLKIRFREYFPTSAEPVEVLAPGRINLIGEHTDYNGGFVLPCAIGQHIRVVLAPNGTNRCTAVSLDSSPSAVIEIPVENLQPEVVRGLSGYLMGVVYGLQKYGYAFGGFDVLISGDIPVGAGLSSSAALCCGIGFAISEAFGLSVTRMEIALIAQQAEHLFAGVRCGLMDQYASLFGKEDHAILLDCKSMESVYVPMQLGEHRLLLADSRVHHELAASAYNARRASCEEGVAVMRKRTGMEINCLRDADLQILHSCHDHMSSETFQRCSFVLEEIERTRKASHLLREGEINAFGELMYETHEGLSKVYEVSCKETDELVQLAHRSGMVTGARMMGGGFGGCTLNLVRSDQMEQFQLLLREKYLARFGKEPHFYQVSAGSGVRRV